MEQFLGCILDAVDSLKLHFIVESPHQKSEARDVTASHYNKRSFDTKCEINQQMLGSSLYVSPVSYPQGCPHNFKELKVIRSIPYLIADFKNIKNIYDKSDILKCNNL